jgi:hypothetical protein
MGEEPEMTFLDQRSEIKMLSSERQEEAHKLITFRRFRSLLTLESS